MRASPPHPAAAATAATTTITAAAIAAAAFAAAGPRAVPTAGAAAVVAHVVNLGANDALVLVVDVLVACHGLQQAGQQRHGAPAGAVNAPQRRGG